MSSTASTSGSARATSPTSSPSPASSTPTTTAPSSTGCLRCCRAPATALAVYWSADLDDLLTFISDPGVAAAVEDGSQYFPHFNELDGDTYTGNIYVLGEPADGPAATER